VLHRLTLFLVLVAVFIAQAPVAGAAEAKRKTFTFATFNINWGNPNLKEIAQVIRQSQADLVALQETNAASERFLRAQLGRQYRYAKFLRPTDRYGAGGFGFLSKVPLKNFSYLKAKDGLFGTWLCEIEPLGHPVQVVNVHLQPFYPLQGDGLGKAMQMIGRVEAVHVKEIERIAEQFSKTMPVVVLGDFNSPSMLTTPRFMAKQGFVDTFAAVTDNADGHPTWQWRFTDRTLSFRLDYIFYRGDFKTVASRIVRTEASDHGLVLSKLESVVAAAKAEDPPQAAVRPGD